MTGPSDVGVVGDLGIPDSGAAVLRLRTRSDAAVRGHALLIGSPFDGLGGVARCLRRVTSWLLPRYEVVDGPLEPTKALIEGQVSELVQCARPRDHVLVYYAGHGMQEPDPKLHDRPVTAFLPIDAREGGSEGSRLIPGKDVVDWLARLADTCVVVPGSARARDEDVQGSVTMVFECCHAAGVTESWPAAAMDCAAIVRTMARRLEESRVTRGDVQRGPDPLSKVLRVMASGRDEWAQGPTVNDVGLMTEALVTLLERHPHEPWWAVMDRLRAQWVETTQHPEVAGPDASIPSSGHRFPRPRGLWPCRRVEGRWWHCELARAEGCRPGRQVVLSSSLAVAEQARGRLELVNYECGDRRGARETTLGIRVEPGAETGDSDFAWARVLPPMKRAIVDVRGGDGVGRAAVVERVEPYAKIVRDLGAEAPARPTGASRDLFAARTTATLDLEVGVVVRDRWGDVLARVAADDHEAHKRWIDRLAALDDWLAMAEHGGDFPADAFELRWGTWKQGRQEAWGDAQPTLSSHTPLWVELEASIRFMPAFASIFRVRADRVVESLTEHVPSGLPVTDWFPLARLGEGDRPLRMSWPSGLDDEGPRWEVLVAMVSDLPLPLALLRRGPIRGDHDTKRGPGVPRSAKLGMLVKRYQLVR